MFTIIPPNIIEKFLLVVEIWSVNYKWRDFLFLLLHPLHIAEFTVQLNT